MATEKSVHSVLDLAKANQAQKALYKPPLDHPWKRRSYIVVTDVKTASQKEGILVLEKRGHF